MRFVGSHAGVLRSDRLDVCHMLCHHGAVVTGLSPQPIHHCLRLTLMASHCRTLSLSLSLSLSLLTLTSISPKAARRSSFSSPLPWSPATHTCLRRCHAVPSVPP